MGALEDLTEAVRAHPSHIPSRSAKARLLLAKNRAEEATEDVDQLVDRQPNCLDHRLLRIQQRLSIGDPATALEDANHMAKDALPGDEILRHQAWLLSCIGDSELRNPKEALEIARQGCDATGGSDPDWLETLAAAWASLNQFEGAIGWQTKALQILDDCALPEQQSRLELYKAHKPFRLK
jgi:tetratricopeptide (TPR) repeat protein